MSIVNFCIFFWIIIYIAAIYGGNKVQYPRYEKNEEDPDGGVVIKYQKQTKANYIFIHVIGPFINGIAFLFFFFYAKDHADVHKDQDKAFGWKHQSIYI